MRIHRLHPDCGTPLKELYEFRQFIFHKTETVHTAVDFDMDGIILNAPFAELGIQGLQGSQIRDAGFEPVVARR